MRWTVDEIEGPCWGSWMPLRTQELLLRFIGDTARPGASKVFPSLVQVNPSDNPLDTNYDWAQWKLGADEIGAKTPDWSPRTGAGLLCSYWFPARSI